MGADQRNIIERKTKWLHWRFDRSGSSLISGEKFVSRLFFFIFYRTALQGHVAFFDRDNDGIVTVIDTYRGFRRLTYNRLLSFFGAIDIHLAFSHPTRLGFTFFPDPFFRLWVKDMHEAGRGSHSGIYDTTGQLDNHGFEKIIGWYSWSNRNGRIGEIPEWSVLWILCFDASIHGIWEEDIRAQYDGSTFWKIEEMAQRGEWKCD